MPVEKCTLPVDIPSGGDRFWYNNIDEHTTYWPVCHDNGRIWSVGGYDTFVTECKCFLPNLCYWKMCGILVNEHVIWEKQAHLLW